MMQKEFEKIKKIFYERNLKIEIIQHEVPKTSEELARTVNYDLKQGIKAIVLSNGQGEYLVVNIPANEKVNMKKVAEQIGWPKSRIKFALPEEVEIQTGCKIGEVPPLYHKKKLPILIDKKIYWNKNNFFTPGIVSHTIKIKTETLKDLFKKVDAIEGEWTK